MVRELSSSSLLIAAVKETLLVKSDVKHTLVSFISSFSSDLESKPLSCGCDTIYMSRIMAKYVAMLK